MRTYLDSSAIVKLVQREAETAALRRHLRRHPDDHRVTSALAEVEVVRAVTAGGPGAVARARSVFDALHLVPLDAELLDDAAEIGGVHLRSLDAIHLAAARRVGDLRAVLTYDRRMADAAAQLGIPTVAP